MITFFVDDMGSTGTAFHGGTPVMVTTASNGLATTDVALIAGNSPGNVRVRATTNSAATTFSLTVDAPA
ncbi:hypothetical protein ADK70_17730 [Streptomyces rimosus subsp. pseudoverticillatus]|nr:hypothetical protein ADK70_17730 [Streptomyces rimosus subsp. pseudoverticillatus]